MDQFRTVVEQTEVGVCFISETWDRTHLKKGKLISESLEIEGYKWVRNVCQSNRGRGKPHILISEKDFHITEISPEPITVPVNVEVAWALLTPKRKLQGTRINHIVVASVYYSSTQTSRVAFLDHISESYHALCSNYGSDLKFIIGGDVNRLNIKPILNLSAGLTQMVKVPTRKNPDAILDIIITNISALYEQPYTLQPLENDEDKSGVPSDHLIVIMKLISNSSQTMAPSSILA